MFSESPECSPSVLDQELSIDSSLQVTAKLWLWANKRMVVLEKRNNVLEETLANKKGRTLVALAVKQAVRLSSILTRKIHS